MSVVGGVSPVIGGVSPVACPLRNPPRGSSAAVCGGVYI